MQVLNFTDFANLRLTTKINTTEIATGAFNACKVFHFFLNIWILSFLIFTRLLHKQRFFHFNLSVAQLFSWIEPKMLLSVAQIYNQHYTETHFIFSISVSMSRPRSIYVVSMGTIFHFQPHFHCHWLHNLIKTDPIVFSTVFRIHMSYYFGMITWIKNANYFQIVKVQPQGVA